ncbi:MAG: YtxH protein [Subtercola sp.]|jgi:hypothetical protein|nr:YtxH protein [Subtercola sp.]
MKGKVLIVVGFGVGYLAGSASGRRRYEQLKSKANEVLNDPQLKKAVKDAGAFVADKAPGFAEAVQNVVVDTAKKVPEKAKDAAAKVREGAEDGYNKASS